MFIHFRCPGEDEVFDVMANAKLIYEVNNLLRKAHRDKVFKNGSSKMCGRQLLKF